MTDNDEVPNSERSGSTARKALAAIAIIALAMASGAWWALT